MWLNYILKISSDINKKKEQIVDAGITKTIGLAFVIIFLEVFQLIISLPVYIFVKPDKFSSDKKEIERYRLKRKYSFFGVLGFLAVIFLKVAFTGGVFLALPSTPVRALSVAWGFDSLSGYIYDSSKLQIADGIVIFRPKTQTETPTDEAETQKQEQPSNGNNTAPAQPVSWLNKILTLDTCNASIQDCMVTIQPVSSLSVSDLAGWTGFVEIASKNGGEIYYQLSDDDGATWYFYNNEWKKVEGADQYNTADEVNKKIKDFPTKNQKIMFKAFLVSDCEKEIQLIDIAVNYNQKQKEQPTPQDASEGLVNKAPNKDSFKASVTNKGSAKDLAESEPLSATWTVNQGGENLDIWVRYDMGTNTTIGSYEITPTVDSIRTPKKWLFQGSNSLNDNYETLDEQSRVDISGWTSESPKYFKLSKPADFQYYRILIQESNHESRIALARFRIFAYDESQENNGEGHLEFEKLHTIKATQENIKTTNTSRKEINSTTKDFYIDHKENSGENTQVGYLEIKKDINISSWNVDSDLSKKISVIHIGDNDRSAISKIKLITKKSAGDDYVRVCPGARVASEVHPGCDSEIKLTASNPQGSGYKLVSVDDESTWQVESTDMNKFSTGIQSGTVDLEDGLVSLWKFDENTGCVANDIFGSNTGTLGQTCPGTSPAWTSGIFNSALGFSANNQRVVIPDSSSLGLTTKGSLVAWVNISSYSSYAGIMHKGQLSNFSDSAYFMQMGGAGVGTSNNKKVVCGGHDGTTDKFFVSNQELSLNTWYHLVYTWDGSGQKMYINSNLDASTATAVNTRVTNGSLQIGSQVLSNYFFRGKIDEPAIYSYALSASQVASLYNNPVNASIEILTPNGGENLTGGQSWAPVRWNSLNTSGNVKIEYSKDGFVSDVHTIIDSTIDDGAYDWSAIPNDPGDTIKVRVSDVSTPSVNDVSDSNFTIHPQILINVVYPNGGNVLYANSFATIKWTYWNPSRSVKIEYSKDNFVSDIHTVVDSVADDGEYEWLVPNDPSTAVKIRISDVHAPTVIDSSDGNFVIIQSDTNPVGFWKLDENTGCTALDSFGGNNGTLSPSCPSDSPAWVTGKAKSALDFDGLNDFVTINDNAKLNPSSAITLSAWIKWEINPTTGNQWSTIINKNDDNQFRLQHNKTNTAFEFALRTSNTGNQWVVSNTVPQQGVWYSVMGTYDGMSLKIYVNGVLEKSTTCSGYIIGSNRPLNISKRYTNDRYFNGKIDEVGIWNRALSASEIAQIYLEGNNNKPEIEINSVSQQDEDGYVNIDYTIKDTESNFVDLSEYKFSLTGVTGGEITMTPAVTDSEHEGATSLSSSPAGIKHIFVWDAKADLEDTFDDSAWVTLEPNDGIAQGDAVTSLSFMLDTKKPIANNVAVSQGIGSTKVNISYDLFDNQDQLTVELAVSIDGGVTWTVPTASATGDLGTGLIAGTNKHIVWDAGADFDGKDEANAKIRLSVKDKFMNSSEVESNPFIIDTKDPFGLASFNGVSASANEIVWSWAQVVTETNFNGYEIWYGKNLEDVENRTGSAKKWDRTNDNGLSIMGTTSTIITGLDEETKYFAKIWTQDKYGNSTSSSDAEFSTNKSPDITPPFKPILDQPTSPRTEKEIVISGTAEANSRIDLFVNDNKTIPQFTITKSDGSFSGIITLDFGEHTLYVISTDEVGNASAPSEIRFVEIAAVKEKSPDQQEQEKTPASKEVINVRELTQVEEGIFQELIEARENPILSAPQISTIAASVIDNNIKFSGTGIPNSEIILFIHSDQAITYKIKVSHDGNWDLNHSQSEVELEDGEHKVYGVTLNSPSHIKSPPSSVINFTVKENFITKILSYFDVPTTLLTVFLAIIGVLAIIISRKKSTTTL